MKKEYADIPIIRIQKDSFSFEYGIVVFKHRFSIKRSLNDYEETVINRCIALEISFVYKTMACDKLVTEICLVYKDENDKLQSIKKDLHDYNFKVIHKGDMSINL